MFSLSEIFQLLGWKEYLLIALTIVLIVLPNDGKNLKRWWQNRSSS